MKSNNCTTYVVLYHCLERRRETINGSFEKKTLEDQQLTVHQPYADLDLVIEPLMVPLLLWSLSLEDQHLTVRQPYADLDFVVEPLMVPLSLW